jgi:tRNA-splicing ligase RtcB
MTALQDLSRAEAERKAEWIEGLPYVTEVLRLPDLHMKDGMEAPSSLVVATDGVVIPHLVSESINDGMGLVATELTSDDLSSDDATRILRLINGAGALSKAKPSRYSWTPKLLEAACREGAAPLLEHYGLDRSFVDMIEDGGRSLSRELTDDEFTAAVPRYLRSTRLTRSEIGLNFAGNHFLEVQIVDEIVDTEVSDRWGLRPGQVVVMYHLGPGPLGSILSNLYAFRAKPQLHRKLGYAFFRNVVHAGKGRTRRQTFAAFSKWLTLDPRSAEGAAYANVLNVVKNYGFAYRTATIAAIVDAVHEVSGVQRESSKLVVEIYHNMLQPEVTGDTTFWVSRHNCCRPRPGLPGIVAGNHQVPSCLGVGPPGCDARLSGYDHGVGFLIDQAQREGRLGVDPRGYEINRLVMTRGTDRLHEERVLPLLDRWPLDGALQTLSDEGMARPVAYLRPLATLKHKP